jgi:hypothetical protein
VGNLPIVVDGAIGHALFFLVEIGSWFFLVEKREPMLG